MKVKSYNEEEHEEYLPDVHKPYYSKSDDLEKFQPVVEEAFEELNTVVDFDENIKVVIAETDEKEMHKDAPDDYYFHGFSFDDGMRGYEGKAIFIRVSDKFDWWKDAFKDMLIHETGHQIFYQRENQDNWGYSQYSSIMFEGHAENLADIVNQKFNYDWNPIWRKDTLEVNKEHLYEDLKEPRNVGDEEDSKDHDMFLYGGERWSDAEGYTAAYQIVRYLLQESKIELKEFINTEAEEWKPLVDSAIEELY